MPRHRVRRNSYSLLSRTLCATLPLSDRLPDGPVLLASRPENTG